MDICKFLDCGGVYIHKSHFCDTLKITFSVEDGWFVSVGVMTISKFLVW